jgi:signal transduction histidine kinase/DNA-binding NarL/FixJ family response regulator
MTRPGATRKVPRFSMIGVVISSLVVYFLLTIFLMLFVWVKSFPDPILGAPAPPDAAPPGLTFDISVPSFLTFSLHTPEAQRPIVRLLRALSLLAIVAVPLGHVPISSLLARRRRGREVSESLQILSERLALRSARSTAVLCFLAAGSDVTARIITLLGGDSRLHMFAVRCIPFYVVTALLVSFFVYYWQNYRIAILYSPYIFTRTGFVRGSPRPRRKTIRSQILLSKVITALLPIALVILFLVALLSSADMNALPEAQRSLLLGDFARLYAVMVAQGEIPGTGSFTMPYLNVADTVLFMGGMATAFGITLVMLLLISKWSTLSIVVPLQELQHNVMATAEGDFSHETPVRDTDEIGELTENFNGMLASLRGSERLRIEMEAADTANRAKSAFLATMSHELRTPLNAILGFSQILGRSGTLDADQRQSVATISQSGAHLLSLINDILDMSKIEAGRTELHTVAFDFREMLGGIEGMFVLKARDKGLALIFDLAPDIPRHVRTDEGKLRQVLVNLMGNAVKFTERGGITLRARSRPEAAGDVRLMFEVEDTGVGIAPGDLEAIFEPFVQSRNAPTAQEGTGLGLAISRGHIQLLGGKVAVQSELGKGSIFSFDLRAALAAQDDVTQPRLRRTVVGVAPGQQRFRILVAEDRDSNRELLMKLLAPLELDVRGVKNGAECVSMWESWQPHLIWMDMRMPVMDGYEATRRIKASARGQATVVIALTASAFESDRRLILSEGCDDFVRKPFVEEEIFEKLEKHLGLRFVTEEQHGGKPDAAPEPAAPLTAELLSPLPAQWRAEFHKATVEADYARLARMVEEIRPDHPDAAAALAALLRGFEYEKILAALDS